MREKAAKTTTHVKPVDQQTPSTLSGVAVAVQMLDTAWRVAVPIIAFSLIGIHLDNHFHTKPLYTIVGLFVSLVVVTLLMYQQIKSAYPEFFKKGNK